MEVDSIEMKILEMMEVEESNEPFEMVVEVTTAKKDEMDIMESDHKPNFSDGGGSKQGSNEDTFTYHRASDYDISG